MFSQSRKINSKREFEDNDDYLKGDIEIGVTLDLLIEAFFFAGIDVYLMGVR